MKKVTILLGILALGLVFGFAGCSSDSSAPNYTAAYKIGNYTGALSDGSKYDTSATVSATAITGTNVIISNVSAQGGGTVTATGYGVIGTWTYVYSGSNKIGVAVTYTTGTAISYILLGKTYVKNGISSGYTTGIVSDDITGPYTATLSKPN